MNGSTTVGIELLCSILRDKNIRHFNRLNYDWFIEDTEKELYSYIDKFLARYNNLPAIETVERSGRQICYPVESSDYYLDVINNRYTLLVAKRFTAGIDNVKQQLTQQIMSGGGENSREVQEYIKKFCTDTLRMFDSGRRDSKVREFITEILPDFRNKQLENRFRQHDLGVMTPYDEINDVMGGFMPEEWCLITGNMKMGKSWTWVNFILHAWLKGNNPTLITSMEMDSMDEYATSGMATRFIAMMSKIAPDLIRSGRLPNVTLDRIENSVKEYEKLKVFEGKGLPPLYFLEDLKNKNLGTFAEEALNLGVTVTGIDAIYKAQPRTERFFRGDLEIEKQVCNDRLAICKELKTINIDTHQFKKDALRVEDVMADNVGGHVGWTQDPNYVFGIIPEGEDGQFRKFKQIAGREGKYFDDFVTHFKFNPYVDFSSIKEYNGEMDTDGFNMVE